MRAYYEKRAREYDATSYEALGHAGRVDLDRLARKIAALSPGRVLDVACGTGYLTAYLRGTIVALDQSEAMLKLAAARVPHATLVRADVPPLPFDDRSFDRVFTSNFYSHLDTPSLRESLVAEALRVGPELVVAEEAWRPGLPDERWEARPLADGSTWKVFKRYYTAERLRTELDGEVLLATDMFIVIRTRTTRAQT